MRPHLLHVYRLGKPDTTGAVFRRVLGTFSTEPLVEFFLHRGDPQQAIKKFPALAAFFRQPDRFASLDSRFKDWEPGMSVGGCRSEVLAEIADGIPRRLPFGFASFYFPEVPWAGIAMPPSLPDTPGTWVASFPQVSRTPMPGIFATSRWAPSRREVQLYVTVPVEPPPSGASKVGPLPDAVSQRLHDLGRFKPPALVVELDASEQPDPANEGRAAAILERWRLALPALIDRLPHALPPDPKEMPRAPGLTSPHKPALLANFRPRGWRHAPAYGGPGAHAVSKRSPRGNKLVLFFDVGTWSHHCACLLFVEGVGWRRTVPITFATGPRAHQYPVVDGQAWTHIVENIAHVVDELERTALAELEALYPAAPAWFGEK